MTMQNLSGQLLGQYELREMLGFGGMGVAYRGLQRNLEREVAIKVLFPGLSSEGGYIERFYREAKTAASLEHAHIVPVYDYGVQGDISYVVMRLLTGGTLEDRMLQRSEQEKPLPSLGEVSNLLTQLASALDYAHSRGVIHRDIKPGNIMFDDQGLAYIVDFGIAKLMESSTSYTATGSPIGTPIYMPPEQWRSEELTPAADQYAMAVTIYQLLTARLPFEATTPYGMLHKHLHEEPTPPQTYRDDLPFKVQEALIRAMEKDPADRWESMTAFAVAFETSVRGQTGQLTGFFEGPVMRKQQASVIGTGPISISVSPDSPLLSASASQVIPPYRQPTFWVMGILLLAALVVVAVLLLTQGDSETPAATVSADELRMLVLTELAETQSAELAAEQNAAEIAQTAVAVALTGTASAWTPTNTPDVAATATEASVRAAAATELALDGSATAEAWATGTQSALLAIAQATAEARVTETAIARFDASTQTQQAEDAAATATQDVVNVTATAGARATATQAELDAQATGTQSFVNAAATTAAQATGTQEIVLTIAQGTANARATGTQAAFFAEATANAATATPTPTNTPTHTPTPTATATPTQTYTPSPTPLPPVLRVTYNGGELILLNISGGQLDISQLVFESARVTTVNDAEQREMRVFRADEWGTIGGMSPARMRAGGCYQLVTGAATQIDPPRNECPAFLGFRQVTVPRKQFWVGPGETFSVRYVDADEPFAVCEINAGECEFALP